MPHTVSQIIKYRKKVLLIDQRNHKGCLNVGEPQRLHQALSCCSNNKALLYPIKKRVCACQPILPLLRLCFLLFYLVSCLVFCLAFCLFFALCSDFFLPCFLIADDILTTDFVQIRFCAETWFSYINILS